MFIQKNFLASGRVGLRCLGLNQHSETLIVGGWNKIVLGAFSKDFLIEKHY